MFKTLVIIVTYNAHHWIRKCLDSVDMNRYDVFIADNCSSDDTIDIIRAEYSKVILHEVGKNLGFGQANNIGFRYAIDNDYDFVFLMNQDAWIMADTIEKLISAQQQQPEYWALSPLQLNSERHGLECNFENFLRKNAANKVSIDNLCNSFSNDKEINSSGIIEMSFVNAALWLLPINCIKIVGGFNPVFPHYGEDIDYINRIHYWEGKVGVDVSTKSYHEHKSINISRDDEKLYHEKICFLVMMMNINNRHLSNSLRCYMFILRKSIKYVLNFDRIQLQRLFSAYKLAQEMYSIKYFDMAKCQCAFL